MVVCERCKNKIENLDNLVVVEIRGKPVAAELYILCTKCLEEVKKALTGSEG